MKVLLAVAFALAMSLSSVAQNTHSVQLSCFDTDILAVQFHFYGSNVKGGPYTQLDTPLTKLTTCNFTETGVLAGASRFYVAKSANVTGDLSAASNEATAVLPAPPATPTGLAAAIIP